MDLNFTALQQHFLLVMSVPLAAIVTVIISAVFGIGGGFFVVPLINYLVSVFFPEISNSMAIATTTSLVNILIVNGVATFKRRNILFENKDALLMVISCAAIGGILGSYLTKTLHDDVLHIIFALFLCFVLVLRKIMKIFNAKIKNIPRHFYPMILIPVTAIAAMCGIGGGIIIFPLMLTLKDDAAIAAAYAGTNSMILSSFSLIFTLLYPSSVTKIPFFFEDVFLPMTLCSLIFSPIFSPLGIYFNKITPRSKLDRILTILIIVVMLLQFITV